MIFFGDIDDSVCKRAKESCSTAVLISHDNYQSILADKILPDVGYTSLGDLPKDMSTVYAILDLAHEIIYCPPTQWSDNQTADRMMYTESIQGLSEMIMFAFDRSKQNVKNFVTPSPPHDLLRLADVRCSSAPQLWVAGCSISHGVGVDADQRYGALLADRLALPVSFLTAVGSSPEWAADQIMRSDIQAGDIVIWGLTGDTRTPWINSAHDLVHVCHNSDLDRSLLPSDVLTQSRFFFLDLLTSKTRIYKSITSVQEVANYCAKTHAKLVVLGVLQSDTVTMNLAHLSQFVAVPHLKHQPQFIDTGSDNLHPGPQQHQAYCQLILNHLQTPPSQK